MSEKMSVHYYFSFKVEISKIKYDLNLFYNIEL